VAADGRVVECVEDLMERVVVIGNSGGGKSTLARKMARRFDLPHVELDALVWRSGWRPAPPEEFRAHHARLIGGERWIIDGLGRRESVAARLGRATEIVLVDMPLWIHYWLAAKRHAAGKQGTREAPPGGFAEEPPVDRLFRTMWDVDREWMPEMRRQVADEATRGKTVFEVTSLEELDEFTSRVT
jgi:adenylate kinase family enzyme